jgi:murein DD-endopeptidase / murein LD-carboxypeptidase
MILFRQMIFKYASLLFCLLLFSCAAKTRKESDAEYYFSGKNEWGNMANDFKYPAELEKRIEDFLGIPYVWGGNNSDGLDCSAFVKQVYEIYGFDLPRTSALQSKLGIEIPREALLPGDLVFFGETDNNSVIHVGIYMGGNKFANATNSEGVKYSSLDEPYFFSKYLFAKRLNF